MEGTVKWFDARKGYGFIIEDDGGSELYVHYTGIISDGFRTLDYGQRVEYERRMTDRGAQAEGVRVIKRRESK